MAKKTKRLNIYNSNRYFNMHLLKEEEIKDFIIVHKLNEHEIEEEMNQLEKQSVEFPIKNDKHYLIYNEQFNNGTLIQKLFKHGGQVDFYTDSVVPYYVIEQLSQRLNSRAIYYIQKQFSKRTIENVQLAFTACPVIIDVPVVLPDTNPYALLMSLHDLKTSVDRVQFTFPKLKESEMTPIRKKFYRKTGTLYEVKPKYKHLFFKYVQTSLSIWAMYIDLVCTSEEDYRNMLAIMKREQHQRSPKGGNEHD